MFKSKSAAVTAIEAYGGLVGGDWEAVELDAPTPAPDAPPAEGEGPFPSVYNVDVPEGQWAVEVRGGGDADYKTMFVAGVQGFTLAEYPHDGGDEAREACEWFATQFRTAMRNLGAPSERTPRATPTPSKADQSIWTPDRAERIVRTLRAMQAPRTDAEYRQDIRIVQGELHDLRIETIDQCKAVHDAGLPWGKDAPAPSSCTDDDDVERVGNVLDAHDVDPCGRAWMIDGKGSRALATLLGDVRRETVEACAKLAEAHGEYFEEPGRARVEERTLIGGAARAIARVIRAMPFTRPAPEEKKA